MNCVKCKKAIPEDGIFCPYCGKKQQPEKKKRKKRANGSGTVIRKPGNRTKPWEAQKSGIYVGAYATKYEAEQALLRLADLPVSETLNLTFEQVYEKWLPVHARSLTKSGISGYEFAYAHCQPLYDRVFRRLRASDFQQVIMDMEGQGLSKSSCEKAVQLFGQLSKWAIQEEICHSNYAKFVTVSAQQKSTKQPFTAAQIAAILESEEPAAQIAAILLATGCRPNELFAAVTADAQESYFISGSKTEAGKNRIIPVASFGLPAYQSLRAAAIASSCTRLIDAYGGNKTYRNFYKRDWQKLMESLGIENMAPYHCRHTYATLAVQSGIKPEILQKILGHADYNTTVGVYTHLDKSEILQEAAKLTVTDTLQTRKNHPV